ncbi:MAG: hypothetical protein NT069_34345, partial [Planctomycetota bacterium]|nr:hypothetical protein [Planctomycetota bacterium]
MPQELMEFCTQQQRRFDGATTADRRKEQGHFGTPGPIAEFMAGLFANFSKPLIRILDPGAGVGILSAAACHRALANPKVRHLFFELWENDPDLIPVLEQTMRQCQMTLRDSGRHMEFRIRCEDFIVEN